MKKLSILFLLISLIIFSSFAQSKSDKMYDVFDNREGVTNFSFSKSMIGAVDLNFEGKGEEKKVTGELHQIRFMSYNPKKGNLTGPEFIEKAVGYLPSAYKKYETDDSEDAEIWLLGKREKYEECHLFFKADGSSDNLHFVVSFFGDFTVNDINGLMTLGEDFSD